MAKPASKQVSLFKSQEEELADHLTGICVTRGLYYAGLRDRVGENLKVFSVLPGQDLDRHSLWFRTAIQGHSVRVLIGSDRFEYLMDGNGLPLEIPKKLLPSSGRGL
jgi:hypothetical protein